MGACEVSVSEGQWLQVDIRRAQLPLERERDIDELQTGGPRHAPEAFPQLTVVGGRLATPTTET